MKLRQLLEKASKRLGLYEALDLELERFNRMAYLTPTLKITGIPISIDKKIQIIIFRILQELFTNTIKHSKATHLDVALVYENDTLFVKVKDNGVGFNYDSALSKNGIGLSNIDSRIKLIGASIDFQSTAGAGTEVSLTYKPKHL